MRSYDVDYEYATVGATRDIDGACPVIVVCPDRTQEDADRIELAFNDVATARRLARELNRWARIVSAL